MLCASSSPSSTRASTAGAKARSAFAGRGASIRAPETTRVLAASAPGPVPAQMRPGLSPVSVQTWQRVSPVPVQMWAGVSPVLAQMRAGVSPVPASPHRRYLEACDLLHLSPRPLLLHLTRPKQPPPAAAAAAAAAARKQTAGDAREDAPPALVPGRSKLLALNNYGPSSTSPRAAVRCERAWRGRADRRGQLHGDGDRGGAAQHAGSRRYVQCRRVPRLSTTECTTEHD